jgi:2-keto-3-deoxygluconate permease
MADTAAGSAAGGRADRLRTRVAELVRRVPAAGMLLPLFAGTAAHTWGRGLLIGPFTVAVGPGGALTVVGLMLACVGTQIRPRQVGQVAARAGLVLAGATLTPTALAVAYWWRFGPAGVGGVSTPAVVIVALGTSNALWMAISRRYGTPADVGGGMVAAAVNSGPALALLVLGLLAVGHAGPLPVLAMLDALAPVLAGFVGGVVWPGCREPMRGAFAFLLPVMAWCLGCQLDLHTVAGQLLPGTVLGVGEALVSGGLVAVEWALLLHRPAVVGWAAGGVTIGAVIVPPVVGIAEPAWEPYAATATAQVAVAVLASTLTATVLTGVWARWRTPHPDPHPDRRSARQPERAPAVPAARDRIDRIDRLIVRAWLLRQRIAYWTGAARRAGGGTRLDLTREAEIIHFYRTQLGPPGAELAVLLLRAARGPLDHTPAPPPGPIPTWAAQPRTVRAGATRVNHRPANGARAAGVVDPPTAVPR